jgi:hypothetical protein
VSSKSLKSPPASGGCNIPGKPDCQRYRLFEDSHRDSPWNTCDSRFYIRDDTDNNLACTKVIPGQYGCILPGNTVIACQLDDDDSNHCADSGGGSCPSECESCPDTCLGPVDFCAYPETGCSFGAETAGGCCYQPSPILVDVRGNGFDLTDAASGILFDIGTDGRPNRVSWTAAG